MRRRPRGRKCSNSRASTVKNTTNALTLRHPVSAFCTAAGKAVERCCAFALLCGYVPCGTGGSARQMRSPGAERRGDVDEVQRRACTARRKHARAAHAEQKTRPRVVAEGEQPLALFLARARRFPQARQLSARRQGIRRRGPAPAQLRLHPRDRTAAASAATKAQRAALTRRRR